MRMSKAKKRVAIAEDVIASLKAGKFMAAAGNGYVTPQHGDKRLRELLRSTHGESMQKAFEELPPCEVCALGSMLIAGVGRFNNHAVNIDHWVGDEFALREATTEFLDKYFDDKQLELIEAAFEGSEELYNGVVYDFQDWLPNAGDDARLTAIMRNIIKNEGTFVPPKCTVL